MTQAVAVVRPSKTLCSNETDSSYLYLNSQEVMLFLMQLFPTSFIKKWKGCLQALEERRMQEEASPKKGHCDLFLNSSSSVAEGDSDMKSGRGKTNISQISVGETLEEDDGSLAQLLTQNSSYILCCFFAENCDF